MVITSHAYLTRSRSKFNNITHLDAMANLWSNKILYALVSKHAIIHWWRFIEESRIFIYFAFSVRSSTLLGKFCPLGHVIYCINCLPNFSSITCYSSIRSLLAHSSIQQSSTYTKKEKQAIVSSNIMEPSRRNDTNLSATAAVILLLVIVAAGIHVNSRCVVL